MGRFETLDMLIDTNAGSDGKAANVIGDPGVQRRELVGKTVMQLITGLTALLAKVTKALQLVATPLV